MILYSLRFGWWNVALSPAAPQAKSNANDDNYNIICAHIRRLLTQESCDLLALCEVSSADVEYIAENIGIDDISTLDLTDSVGRTRFDMAVIYNNRRILVSDREYLSKVTTGQTVKGAQVVQVTNIDDGKVIYFYLCHWASRLNGDGERKRINSAVMVKDSAFELIEAGNDVIIMGDFNDNPYDVSLREHMNATRCLDAVRKYPVEYLYNPFWRSLVSENMHYHANENESYSSGTLKFKEFAGTMWHSYDQILLSSGFVSGQTWRLNELATKVVMVDEIISDFNNNNVFIDHLPVVCEITRV
ncbi:endonuclease/exonuclease/phosphatase family protein [Plesiomonas shigelloides]|uniref:endonuclease/exonuclease/phosphatase family protein n=1 Tax=Plesiomonas shigelloides TaxID=703 RepID=UPI00111C17F7|nr:endonuclease/exonuclease/phosphatase family protein [Plesiomonas shigelloides]